MERSVGDGVYTERYDDTIDCDRRETETDRQTETDIEKETDKK